MISNSIFTINSENEFVSKTFEIFYYQYQQLPLYRDFCDLLKRTPANVNSLEDIPFLPIRFFRTHQILTTSTYQLYFESSGTTSHTTSRHYISDISLYETSFRKVFALFYTDPSKYLWLALMPDTNERPHSSLLYMVNSFIQSSEYKESGFYLYRTNELYRVLLHSIQQNIPTLLIGLTYALLDFAEVYSLPQNNSLIVMETGGMKGRRKEMMRAEVHQILKKSFSVNQIHSEYGMTELLSQAYSKKNGLFKSPPWMRVLIRDVNNPLRRGLIEKRGGINIIDFANIYSCSFIETEDMGIVHHDGTFEVIGRLQGSIQRGCNTMIE